MGAYVKFVESAGGVAVPIDTRSSEEELKKLTRNVNAVIFPGGGTSLQESDGSLSWYSQKAKVVYDEVKAMNDEGIHIPLWAICLGFQQIAIIENPVKGLLDSLDSSDLP